MMGGFARQEGAGTPSFKVDRKPEDALSGLNPRYARLGEEVVLIEPCGGSSVRRDGPFLDNAPHVERGLPFSYFNAGKRGIAVDLESAEGQHVVRQLAERSDLLIESARPGDGSSTSRSSVRGLPVLSSITPFGQSGPYARYESENLVAPALGRLLYLGGYSETGPITAYGNRSISLPRSSRPFAASPCHRIRFHLARSLVHYSTSRRHEH